MSNSDPSAAVLQGIPCIGGLYISLDSNGENGSLKVAAIHLRLELVEVSMLRYDAETRGKNK